MHITLRRLFLLAALLLVVPWARADSDRWYAVEMFGKRSGHMHSVETNEDDRIITRTSVVFGMKRADAPISIEMNSEFVETADGKPISMKSVQKMGKMDVVQEYLFKEDGVETTTMQSGQKTTSKQPIPEGTWLTPAAADRYMTQRFKSGAKEIVVRSIDAMSGLKIQTTTHTIGEKTTIKALGRGIEVIKTTVETTAAPGIKSTEFIDDEGVLVRNETMLGTLAVVMTATTEADAKSESGEPAPEVFTQTFIKPDVPIEHARSLKSATYLVSVPDGTLPDFPTTGSQTVVGVSPTSARVTINAETFSAAPAADAGNAVFLASTTACNTGDDRIKELSERAVEKLGEGATAMQKAEACRAYTYKFIKKKSLGVGFATATEVARTREGDCSEHGVFLATLLRSNGIPSRVASGLVYADSFAGSQGIFGYHMWSQALIEIDGKPRWVDLDGTLPGVAYDATHICLAVSNLSDDEGMTSMISIAQAMGRLAIKMEK